MEKTIDLKARPIDVLVVGAGPAGVALAAGLRSRGLSVVIVERSVQPSAIFKGEYFQPLAAKILRGLGLREILETPDVNSISELRFRDLGPDHKDVISEIVIKYPYGYSAKTLTHFQLTTRFRNAARNILGEDLWEGASIQITDTTLAFKNKRPLATVKHPTRGEQKFAPRWVIGADGRNSYVRGLIKAKNLEKMGGAVIAAPNEYIVGAEIHTPAPKLDRYEVVRTFKQGTFSIFGISGFGQRVYWNYPQSAKDKNIKPLWKSRLGELNKTIDALKPHGHIDPNNINGAAANTSISDRVVQGHFILVGDAAGVTTPYGGQGLTMSMIHVNHLVHHFDFKEDRSRRVELMGETYQRFVFENYSRVNLLNLGLYHLFLSRAAITKAPTRHVISTWHKNPELAERTIRLFGGIDIDKPGALEVMRLWGISDISRLPSMVRTFEGTSLWNLPKWFTT